MGWYGQLKHLRGANDVSLPYVSRDTAKVTDAIQAIIYLNSDKEFMFTFLLEGDGYVAYSMRVYNEHKPLVIDASGWAHICIFDKLSDCRAALEALKQYTKEESSKKIRMAVAYTIINTCYNGSLDTGPSVCTGDSC